MSVTLNTQLEELMFSSQIPDLDLSTSDDQEAVVSIVSGGTTVFSATHIPYSRNITVHDIRSVVEYYMRQGNHALRSFSLRAKHNNATQTLATFQVIYLEQHFTGDIEEFLRNNAMPSYFLGVYQEFKHFVFCVSVIFLNAEGITTPLWRKEYR